MSFGANSNSTLTKVHLIGGDSQGWALDVDLRMTKEALTGLVEFVDSPLKADVIHSVNAEMLVSDPRIIAKLTPGKQIIAQFTSMPARLFEEFPKLYQACQDWVCVAQSQEAFECLQRLKVKNIRSIPYVAELQSFTPVAPEDERLINLRRELKLPEGKYIVGSFVRDSLGANLNAFKPQKGADIFLAILLGVAAKVGRDKIHVLLAGPRRHWLRKQLDAHGISYTFDGVLTNADDNPQNILPLSRINLLINLIDLYIIPSRWEGAPAGLFHVIACKKKIISTDIAAPRDVLPPSSRFQEIGHAIQIILDDIKNNTLSKSVEANHEKVMSSNTPVALRKHWAKIYQELKIDATPRTIVSWPLVQLQDFKYTLKHKYLWKPYVASTKLRKKITRSFGGTINIWGEMGAGLGERGRSLLPVAIELERRGFTVRHEAALGASAHILNFDTFDIVRAKESILRSGQRTKILHRRDERTAPTSLKASITAFTSQFAWEKALGESPIPASAMILGAAIDPRFFHPAAKREERAGRKLRIFSTAPIIDAEAAKIYKVLDECLDFSRYEFRALDNGAAGFRNIQQVSIQSVAELGEQYRWADIALVFGSVDPATALMESLSCGLPTIYARHDACAEVAGYGAIPFSEVQELPQLILRLEENYASYAFCASTRTVKDIVDQYLAAFEL